MGATVNCMNTEAQSSKRKVVKRSTSFTAAQHEWITRQAEREMRTFSGMLAFMIESYMRQHPEDSVAH